MVKKIALVVSLYSFISIAAAAAGITINNQSKEKITVIYFVNDGPHQQELIVEPG